MKNLIISVGFIILLTDCSNHLEAVLEKAEFEDDETGCVSVTGDIRLGTGTFGNGTGTLVYKKEKLGVGDQSPSENIDCSL